jgi:predicted unusual protein kinase regulating ubiquinone biosynthesis (AarF/ABC1/UbiB family)
VSAAGTDATPELDPQAIARRGADVVLKQILVHGLFHADPHPGNILVLPGSIVASSFRSWPFSGVKTIASISPRSISEASRRVSSRRSAAASCSTFVR